MTSATSETSSQPTAAKQPASAESQELDLGTVAFIFGGPGDPELVTLRAMKLIAAADVVVVDGPVAEIAHAHAGPHTQVEVAVDEDGTEWDASSRVRPVSTAAKDGLSAVRIFAGDPTLDGRLIAEIALLRRSKIPYEIAPGISDITAVPLYAGIGLTSSKAKEIRVLDMSPDAPEIEWESHTDPKITLIIRDGAERITEIADGLLKAGRSETAPVAITRAGTTVEQFTIAASLGEIVAESQAVQQAATTKLGLPPGLTGPGYVVIGDVVNQRDRLSWFETKPLFGWRVLVPRTKDEPGVMSAPLARLGAVPEEVPTISVEPPRTPQQMERAIQGIETGRYEWIAFTSPSTVRAIRQRFEERGLDARSLSGLKIAAVGAQTVQALVDFGVKPDLIPEGEQTTYSMVAAWPPYDDLLDPINRVLVPRADIATETLVEGMNKLGWEVDDVTAFRTVRAAPPPAPTREAIKSGAFDAVIFTSASTVRNLVGIAGKPHATTVIACIGPATEAEAKEHGLKVDVIPERPTMADLVDALAAHASEMQAEAEEKGDFNWRPSRKRAASRRRAKRS